MRNKIYFKDLDALRSIAALMVFYWHASKLGTSDIKNLYLKNFLYIFNGGVGVLIFFVLSGFLISYLILSEIDQRGKFNLGAFYLRRALRIWPLYFALLIFGYYIFLPVLGHFSDINVQEIRSHAGYYFSFLSNFDVINDPLGNFAPISITWSVAIEEQFYLVWPLLFFFTPPSKYRYVFFGVLIISLVFRIINYDQPNISYYHTLSVVSYLAIGGIAAYYSLNSHKIAKAFKGNNWIIYIVGFLFMYLQSFFHLSFIVVTIITALFFAWVILDQVHNRSSQLKLSRLKILTKMGKYTYGIYMLHQTVLFSIMVLVRRAGWESRPVLVLTNFVVGLPVTLLLAYLSYRFLEKRFLLLKERFAFARTTNTAHE